MHLLKMIILRGELVRFIMYVDIVRPYMRALRGKFVNCMEVYLIALFSSCESFFVFMGGLFGLAPPTYENFAGANGSITHNYTHGT